jgi:hypothetical protein
VESRIQEKKLPNEMRDQPPSLQNEETQFLEGLKNLSLRAANRTSSEGGESMFKQSLEREVELRCENFKKDMEKRFLKSEHSTQAQVAIEKEENS